MTVADTRRRRRSSTRKSRTQAAPSAAVTVDSLKESPTYAEELGIDLGRREDGEVFKWFLASVLFGARISETIAGRTYRAFEKYQLLTPRSILDAGWSFLVNPVMREGGYVRYDEKTSREILRNCEQLIGQYGGSLNRMHEEARDGRDLEERILSFYGVGPVTANIFLRELRPYWEKADAEPLPVVKKLARKYRIDLEALERRSPAFVRIEAGLVRLRNTLKAGKRPKVGRPSEPSSV